MCITKCIFLVVVLHLLGVLSAESSENHEVELDQRPVHSVDSLTIRDQIGQMLFIGFAGVHLNDDLKRRLDHLRPGGIVVYSRNIQSALQIAKLNYDVQKWAKKNGLPPLLIAIDQEGGSVSRIRLNPPLPSGFALGYTQDPSLTEEMGRTTGKFLSLLGFNMNLAPVVDLNRGGDNTFLKSRSFGSDPKEVGVLTASYAKGLKSAGVIPTAKHFPGHGQVSTDSHLQTPSNRNSYESLKETDLVPFKKLTDLSSYVAVMVGHISYPKIDQSRLPATYSSILVDGILRKAMNFRGLVLTDDIEMGGAGVFRNVGERAVESLRAGTDMIMIAWSWKAQTRALEAIQKAIANGNLSRQRLRSSVERILATKNHYDHEDVSAPTLQELKEQAERLNFEELTANIIRKNIRRSLKALPELHRGSCFDQQVILFSAVHEFREGFQRIRKNRIQIRRINQETVDNLKRDLKSTNISTVVVHVVGPQTARMANEIISKGDGDIIVINGYLPTAIRAQGRSVKVINVLAYHARLPEILVQEL